MASSLESFASIQDLSNDPASLTEQRQEVNNALPWPADDGDQVLRDAEGLLVLRDSSEEAVQRNLAQPHRQTSIAVNDAQDVTAIGELHMHINEGGDSRSNFPALETIDCRRELEIDKNIFVKTWAFKEANEILQDEHVLCIIGPPGSGKTMISRQLLCHLSSGKQEVLYSPKVVKHPSDLKSILNREEDQVVWIDDIFGTLNFDSRSLEEWLRYMPSIQVSSEKQKFIFTSRTDIYQEAKSSLKKFQLFHRSRVLDLMDKELALNQEEKQKILEKHLKVAETSGRIKKEDMISGDIIHHIASLQTVHGFPACVKMFVSMYRATHQKPEEFFMKPFKFLQEDLERLYREESKARFGVLLLAVEQRGQLDLSLLDEYKILNDLVRNLLRTVGVPDTTPLDWVKQAAENMIGTYLSQQKPGSNRRLVLSHTAIYDAVAFIFGQNYPQHVVKIASMMFILKRVKLEQTTASLDHFTLCLEEDNYRHLVHRFVKEICEGDLVLVCLHDAFSVKSFFSEFEGICSSLPRTSYKLVTSVDKCHHMPLLYWSTWNKGGLLFRWIVQKLRRLMKTPGGKDNVKRLLTRDTLTKAAASCCMSGNLDALAFLFEASDDFRRKVVHGFPKVGFLPIPSLPMFQQLPKDEGNVSEDAVHMQSLLHIACLHGHYDIVCYLLDSCFAKVNASISRDIPRARTPLHVASKYGYDRIVEKLLEKGADRFMEAEDLMLPVHEACTMGHYEVVRILTDNGQTCLNERSIKGRTPLHWAAVSRSADVVQLLIKLGADVSAEDDDGNLPVHLACFKSGNTHVLEVLGKVKADDLISRNKETNTPLHIVSLKTGDVHMAAFLLESGADIDVFQNQRQSPLHLACQMGHLNLVKFLVQRGANIFAKNSEKKLPINVASHASHTAIVKFLHQKMSDKVEEATESDDQDIS